MDPMGSWTSPRVVIGQGVEVSFVLTSEGMAKAIPKDIVYIIVYRSIIYIYYHDILYIFYNIYIYSIH